MTLSASDSLILRFAQTKSLEACAPEVASVVHDRADWVRLLRVCCEDRFVRFAEFRNLLQDLPMPSRSFALVAFVYYRSTGFQPSDFDEVDDVLSTVPSTTQTDRDFVSVERVKNRIEKQDVAQPVRGVTEVLHRPGREGVYADYLCARAHTLLSILLREQGHFQGSFDHVSSAMEISKRWSFVDLLSQQGNLASLYWISGQPRKAYELHADPEVRNKANELERFEFLAQSHLSAAKCCLDATMLETADAELAAAEECLDHEDPAPVLCGYLQLYTAELGMKLGHTVDWRPVLGDAITRFEAIDPVCYQGVLDAKTCFG